MPHMVTMGNGQSQTIQEMLACIERYNPDHLKTLEAYVEEQAKNNTYDLEANLAVLKLYQFNPHMLNFGITYTILLKCLTNLPHTDFVMAKCLLLPKQMEDETVQTIIELANILECAEFTSFWKKANENKDIFRHITGFHDSIRKFVCHVVGITFQTIQRGLLKELLGNIDGNVDISVYLSNFVKINSTHNDLRPKLLILINISLKETGGKDFNFICQNTLQIYIHLEYLENEEKLNIVFEENSTLEKWIKQNGWKTQSNLVLIDSQEEKIKTKNITEKIEFDNLGGLMAQCL